MIKFMPEFKALEANKLTGLISGHILAQVPVDNDITTVTINGKYDYIENGLIVGLNDDYTIGNYDHTIHAMPFVHYTEELNTLLQDMKYFAVPVDDVDETYIRAIGLYVGDEFITNNYTGADGDFAKVVNGVLTLQAAADTDTMFIAKEATLPNGEDAYAFVYYKNAVVVEEEDGNAEV